MASQETQEASVTAEGSEVLEKSKVVERKRQARRPGGFPEADPSSPLPQPKEEKEGPLHLDYGVLISSQVQSGTCSTR